MQTLPSYDDPVRDHTQVISLNTPPHHKSRGQAGAQRTRRQGRRLMSAKKAAAAKAKSGADGAASSSSSSSQAIATILRDIKACLEEMKPLSGLTVLVQVCDHACSPLTTACRSKRPLGGPVTRNFVSRGMHSSPGRRVARRRAFVWERPRPPPSPSWEASSLRRWWARRR